MKKYPWVVWLSLLGFLLLFAKNSIKILLINKPLDIDKWIRFLGNSLGILFVALIIPMILYTLIVNYIGTNIICAIFSGVFVYLVPVEINCNICRWIKLNNV